MKGLLTCGGCERACSWGSLRRWGRGHCRRCQPRLRLYIHRWVWHRAALLSTICKETQIKPIISHCTKIFLSRIKKKSKIPSNHHYSTAIYFIAIKWKRPRRTLRENPCPIIFEGFSIQCAQMLLKGSNNSSWSFNGSMDVKEKLWKGMMVMNPHMTASTNLNLMLRPTGKLLAAIGFLSSSPCKQHLLPSWLPFVVRRRATRSLCKAASLLALFPTLFSLVLFQSNNG